jgi:hypothetical protein
MTLTIIITKIKNKIWDYLKDFFYNQRVISSSIIQNINNTGTSNQKKVLLCYLTDGYFKVVDNSSIGKTIHFEIFKIVKVFSDLGYCIDLIGCNDLKALEIVNKKHYTILFGFGEAFYQLTKQQTEAVSILYMTENHPLFSYEEEKKRNDYFYTRHKKRVPLKRSGYFYKIKHLEINYSHVITMSEEEPLKRQFTSIYTIFPTGIINTDYIFENKDHQSARCNFLWMGSFGAIHKGLDLLIDVFSKRDDIVLHICGLSSEDRKILKFQKKENIIEYGFIDIKSEVFIKIVGICSYVILPSCSEGFSTSITTCMLHGLIPIIMKNTGFNRIRDYSILLDDFKIDYINTELTLLSKESTKKLEVFSRNVYEFARQNFVLPVFEKNFRVVLNDILKAHN